MNIKNQIIRFVVVGCLIVGGVIMTNAIVKYQNHALENKVRVFSFPTIALTQPTSMKEASITLGDKLRLSASPHSRPIPTETIPLVSEHEKSSPVIEQPSQHNICAPGRKIVTHHGRHWHCDYGRR